jgi:hypothetical protein
MAEHAIPFHFTELDTPHALPVLHRLPSEEINGAATASVLDLVFNHVIQPLVECGPDADESVQPLPCGAIAHGFIASSLIPTPAQEMELCVSGYAHTKSALESKIVRFCVVRNS